jgi:hypothetical protein
MVLLEATQGWCQVARSTDRSDEHVEWLRCPGEHKGRPCNKKLAKVVGPGLYEVRKKGMHLYLQLGYFICTCCGRTQWIPPLDNSKRASVASETSPKMGQSQEANDADRRCESR